MDTMALVLIVVASLIVWGLIRIGIWIGGSKTSRYIVDGFICELNLKSYAKEIKEINLALKHHRPWHPILDSNYVFEERSSAIGKVLAKAGFSEGAEFQNVLDTPKPEEASVTMNRKELFDISWLADYGLRAWTIPWNNEIRNEERLPKDRAETLSSLLDNFERKVADLLSETEDDCEMRFSSSEDRMKRIWENYG